MHARDLPIGAQYDYAPGKPCDTQGRGSSKEDINNNHTAHVDQGDFKHVTNQQIAQDEKEAGEKRLREEQYDGMAIGNAAGASIPILVHFPLLVNHPGRHAEKTVPRIASEVLSRLPIKERDGDACTREKKKV